jgi:hypothetical protein
VKICELRDSVAEPEPGAVIKFPPGAGAIITNYRSGSATLGFAFEIVQIVLCLVI